MPHSNIKQIVVRRSEWQEDDLALLCGIANAGGGKLLISPSTGSHTKRMKHFRKSFESIPRLSKQELNLVCTTEPIMDGIELCLEIDIPSAEFPLRYRNDYYLYTDGINTVVTKDILSRLFDQQTNLDTPAEAAEETVSHTLVDLRSSSHPLTEADAPAPTAQNTPMNTDVGTGRTTFKERSIAAANRLDLTSTDEFILKALETNGRVTAVRIADVLGVSESTVRRSFRRLRENGFIERIGSNKAGYWRLVD